MKYLLSFFLLLTISTAKAQRNVPQTNQVTINLMGHQSSVISADDLKHYEQASLGDVVIKNHKGEGKRTVSKVKGVLLKSLFDKNPITTNKPKELSEIYITLIASDGYKNVYSWNEIFNTEVGNHIYIITEMEGKGIEDMEGAILVMSLADINTGGRYLRGLEKIEVKKVE